MARKVTEARRSALAAAAAFDGLPVKMSRMRLIDRIEIARAALNVSENEYLYLRLAFRNTPEDHWRGGREPIFGWSRVDVARALGKSERSITRIENALVEKGLIVHRDGPMLRRFGGSAYQDGRGVSLAPCAGRHAEIDALAQKTLDEHRLWSMARSEIFAARRVLEGLLASGHDLPAALRDVVRGFVSEVPERMTAGHGLDDLNRLRARGEHLLSTIEAFLGEPEMACRDTGNVTRNTNPESRIQSPRRPVHVPDLLAAGEGLGVPGVLLRRTITVQGGARTGLALDGLRRRLGRSEAPVVRDPPAYFLWLLKKDGDIFQNSRIYGRNAHSRGGRHIDGWGRRELSGQESGGSARHRD